MLKLKRAMLVGAVAAALGLPICGDRLARAADKPQVMTETIKVPNSTVAFDLVKLPAGKVTIKDKDGKDKEVEVKPVWIAKLETRWDEYDVYWQKLDAPATAEKAKYDIENRPSTPYSPPDRGFGHAGWPAGSITSSEAQKYVTWLSKVSGHKYRLPTVAEWTYAAKCGGAQPLPRGQDLKDAAWFSANAQGATGNAQPMETGKKKPNAWGIHDMLGNVAEWCVREDGTPVIMGGGFEDDEADLNFDSQQEYDPKWQRDDPQDPKGHSWLSNGAHIGIRVVRED